MLKQVDGGGSRLAVALPDGGALLLAGDIGPAPSLQLLRIDRHGVPQSTAPVDLSAHPMSVLQLLRRPDGRLLLVGSTQSTTASTGELLVTQLTPAGAIDPSFGNGGTASTGVDIGCGACDVAALDPLGRLVVTGSTGRVSPTPPPGDFSGLRWTTTRLTASGARDTTFGTSGLVTLPDAGASGFNVATLPDGRVVAEAQQVDRLPVSRLLLTRLLPNGDLDPTYNGGAVVRTALSTGFAMLAQSDGSVLLGGSEQGQTTTPFLPGRSASCATTPPAGSPPARPPTAPSSSSSAAPAAGSWRSSAVRTARGRCASARAATA